MRGLPVLLLMLHGLSVFGGTKRAIADQQLALLVGGRLVVQSVNGGRME